MVNNVKQDDLMNDNLHVNACSLAEVTSVVPPDDNVSESIELVNYTDNSEKDRLKELDEYLTALEDIGNLPTDGCNDIVSVFYCMPFLFVLS